MEAKFNFTMYAGDSRYLRITCTKKDGTPIDLSNAQDMNFSINIFGQGIDGQVVKKVISQIAIEDFNVAVVVLDKVDTENLKGKYQCYFQVEDYGGDRTTLGGLCIIKINGI